MLWSQCFWRCRTISTFTIYDTQSIMSHVWRAALKPRGPTLRIYTLKWSHSSDWLFNKFGLMMEVLIQSLHSNTSRPILIRHLYSIKKILLPHVTRCNSIFKNFKYMRNNVEFYVLIINIYNVTFLNYMSLS